MAKELPESDSTLFEKIKEVDDHGNEYWTARDMAKVLDYLEYRNFKPVIAKAEEACENSGYRIEDHFVHSHDMIEIGKGGLRKVENIKLSRYACYLIVQNADPSKEVVALGQTYFATQTRLREIQQMDEYNRLNSENEKRIFLRNEMAKHNTLLAAAAKNAGVTGTLDYAIFQNHGYMGLYGGLDAKGIHKNKGLKKSQQILDHMGSTELAANLFRATQTEEKLRREKINGKQKANQTHYEVGKKVRQTIKDIGGTMPESLPVAGSIKKIETKGKSTLKKKK
jgi:DNA-damage-inducible protein D